MCAVPRARKSGFRTRLTLQREPEAENRELNDIGINDTQDADECRFFSENQKNRIRQHRLYFNTNCKFVSIKK